MSNKTWLLRSSIAMAIACAPPLVRAQEADAQLADAIAETVIVTGTRASGVDEFASASPIQVLDSKELESAGKPDLMSALANVVPSFTAQAFGGDMANQTLQAKMRGLSPNHTLVLVNGKRRHTTSSLAILGGPYQGGAGVDLNFIPVGAIDHVEVLTDGAAAQYGTDAIAGVINIILRKNPDGAGLGYEHGGNYAGDGDTSSYTGNIGFQASSGSYFSVAGEYREHAHTNRGDVDPRVVDAARLAVFPNANMPYADGYPYLNKIFGDAAYEIKVVSLNAGVPLGDAAEMYSTLSWGDKHAASFENYRLPNRVSWKDPGTGELTYFRPFGFSPREETEESDHQATLGIKGDVATWHWDVSSSYGKDEIDLFTRDSANASLYAATKQTPTSFYDGTYTQTQWTSNLDVTKEIEIGLAAPMNLAFGGEFRKETWTADPGDAASRYLEGGQSFPGISTSDSGDHDRDVKAAYVDVTLSPLEKLRLDVAGRYEDYSDFGDTTVGKLSARYELTDALALRATASTGFRAPTLAEEFYSATNVGPKTAFVQMPPNAPATTILGLGEGLQPEKSTNYSAGVVFRPDRSMALTVDLYQIEVRNRIAATSTFYGTIGGSPVSQVIVDAIIANGNVLDPAVTAEGDTGINLFTNGVTTRTRGVDVGFSYGMDLIGANVDWSVAATYTDTKVLKVRDTPAEFGTTQALFDKVALGDLTETAPKFLVNLGARFEWQRATLSVHELVYGKSAQYENDGGECVSFYGATSPNCDADSFGLTYFRTEIPVTPITNLEMSFKAMEQLSVTVGAANVFDKYPDKRNSIYRAAQFGTMDNGAVAGYPSFSPFGINGAYYYGSISYKF